MLCDTHGSPHDIRGRGLRDGSARPSAPAEAARRMKALLPYKDRLVGVEVDPKRAVREDAERLRYMRGQIEKATRGECQTFASWTLAFDDGLAIFNRSPSKSWWV